MCRTTSPRFAVPVIARGLVLLAVAAAGACDDGVASALVGAGQRWSAGDEVFHREPRWLGGDGAYAIELGDERTLWLFGDSFIATSAARVRTEATLVRNSVAVTTGLDLATASARFAWTDGAPPSAYFPADGERWLWPGGGARLPDGSVVVFLSEVVAADGGLGFAAAGWRAVRIADPSGPPDGWRVDAVATAPAAIGARAIVGACVALDGEHLVAMAIDDGSHDGYVVRWPLTDAAAGDLRRPAWWTGQAWEVGGAPRAILTDAATECSLHRDPSTGQWLHVTSRGFGATTIALRTAPRPEGPWSAPTDVFAPPESMVDDAFVYAGKAHPHLRGPTGGLVVTYADNSFTFADLFDPARADTLYWPHTAELALRPR